VGVSSYLHSISISDDTSHRVVNKHGAPQVVSG
jgi:hypothetical protein